MLTLSFFLSFLLTLSFYQCQVRPIEAHSQLARSVWLLLQKQEILWDWSATLNKEWEDDDDEDDDDEREEEEKQGKYLIAMEIELHSNSVRGV